MHAEPRDLLEMLEFDFSRQAVEIWEERKFRNAGQLEEAFRLSSRRLGNDNLADHVGMQPVQRCVQSIRMTAEQRHVPREIFTDSLLNVFQDPCKYVWLTCISPSGRMQPKPEWRDDCAQERVRGGEKLLVGIDVWGGVQRSRLARLVELRVSSDCTLQLLARRDAVRPLRRRPLPARQPAFI